MEDQDIDAMIAGAKTAQVSIPLCLRADVLSEIGELERQIRTLMADDDDVRMISNHDQSAAELADRIRALEKIAEDNTINLRIQALDNKAWKAKVDEHKNEDLETGVEQVDMSKLISDVLRMPDVIVSPSFTPKRLDNLLAVISDAQWEQVIKGVWALNRTTTTVGKSVTASQVFLKRSEKPAPAEQ